MIYLKYLFSGAIIGIANIIPGVSGGTMAVILNLYDQLIGAFSQFRRHWKQSLKLLIPVLIGAVAGIVAFSWLIKFLLEKFPLATTYFFIGLILGSIPMIFRRAASPRFKPLNLIPFVVAIGVMVGLAFLGQDDSTAEAMIKGFDWGNAALLFAAGMVAAAAMILPGVSGSMILMIFGVYPSVLTAISEMNFAILIPAGIGVVIGLVGGAKLIGLFLKHCPQATFWTILGLILGSLFTLFKNAGLPFRIEGLVAVPLLLFGTLIALAFSSERLKNRISGKKYKAKYQRK